MGDIQTHEELSRIILGTFRQYWPNEENYGFFELGNWLTDMSQFNDPYSYISAKLTAWNRARPQVIATKAREHPYMGWTASPREVMDADDHLDMDTWADTMLGTPGHTGELPGFFRNLSFFIGCEWFRRPAYNIQPAQFQTIFNDNFTQYFPHEHLDFPPWPQNAPWGNRDPSTRAVHHCGDAPVWTGDPIPAAPAAPAAPVDAGTPSGRMDAGTPAGGGGSSNRRILGYLDDEIEYVAELLTWVEHEWIRVNAEPPSPANEETKRRILTRWGHASHAIEDFFFHSNFVEFAWFSRHADGSVPTVDGEDHHRQRRNYYRRRRSPAWSGTALSPSTSYAASRIYTGSFGSEDVYHTFADAMEGLPSQYLALVPGDGGRYLQQLGTAQGRRDMADRQGPARGNFLHGWQRWSDTTAATEIEAAVATGAIHRMSADRLIRALDIDRTSRSARHGPDFPWQLIGPFAFFTDMLCASQAEHDASEARSHALDVALRENEDATALGPSAENIGCHSLMSKDSTRKAPLRQQAMNHAAWVACYVARVLARRLTQPGVCAPRLTSGSSGDAGCAIDQLGSVDWLHLLQHFLCHPDECEEMWYDPVLGFGQATEAQRANLPELTHHTLRYLTPSEVAPKLRLQMRDRLARRYRDLETDAERDWSNRT